MEKSHTTLIYLYMGIYEVKDGHFYLVDQACILIVPNHLFIGIEYWLSINVFIRNKSYTVNNISWKNKLSPRHQD